MRRRRPSSIGRVEPSAPDTGRATIPLLVALGLALAIRLGAIPASSNWLWGVDAWRMRPPLHVLVPLAMVLLAAVPAAGRRIERVLDTLGNAWDRGGWFADGFLGLLGSAALFMLRDPLRFPGDSLLRMGMVAKPTVSPALLAQAYPLDRLVNLDLARWLVGRGLTVDTALQAVGAAIGLLFLLSGIRFLRACGARGSALPAGALVLFGGALPLHFVGYDKFGPLLVGLLLAAAGAVRLARAGTGVATFALGAILAALSHRSAFLLLPAIGWVLLRAFSTADDRRSRVTIALAAAFVAVPFALLLPRTLDLVLHYDSVVHLPGGHVEAARTSRGWMDLVVRFTDALNVTSYLVPLGWLAVAVVPGLLFAKRGAPAGAAGGRFPLFPVTLLALAAAAAILLGVEPGAGWPRDWDVATGPGTLLACACAGTLVGAWRGRAARQTLGPTFVFAVAILVATWAAFLDRPATLRRARELAEAPPARTAAIRTQTYDFLANRAYNENRAAESAELFDRAIDCGGPNPRLLYQAGLAYVLARQPDSAEVRFRRAVTLDPGLANAWSGLASIAWDSGRIGEAEGLVDTALALQPSLHSANYIRNLIRQASSGTR